MNSHRARPTTSLLVRLAGVAVIGVMLLLGCAGSDAGGTFAFEAPDPPCPPPSALSVRPLADERSDMLFDPALTILAPTLLEDDDHFRMICTYERDSFGEVEDTTIAEGAAVSAEISLYPSWADAPNSEGSSYDELPTASAALSDWERAAVVTGDLDVLRASCGGDFCHDGEEPTARSYQVHWEFAGHVDNVDFSSVSVTYQVEHLPVTWEAELVPQVLAIFRDLVLAVLDSYQRAG